MQLRLRSEISGSVVVVDLGEEYRNYAGSRFTVYALYPECNVAITLQPNADNDRFTFAVGKSIVNRSSQADIGTILLEYAATVTKPLEPARSRVTMSTPSWSS